MDVERSIEHLLDLHAKAEIRLEKAEVRADKADARMDRFDKQLKVTANLVRAGMKIVVKNSKDIAFLIASHRRLEKKMDRVIDLLVARSGNGRNSR